MTAIVGIFCKDGVVVGADSAATSVAGAQRTIEQPTMKIDIIDDRIIVAGTGEVGMGQRFCHQVRNLWVNKQFSGLDEFGFSKKVAQAAMKDFGETGCRPGTYGALVAFPCNKSHHLVEYALSNFQPEFKNENMWYVSMGSGQFIIDPFLGLFREVFWGDGPPSVQEATFATTWMLDQAVNLNPGGVNAPVRIAVLETEKGKHRARLLTDDELLEHHGSVTAAKDALRNYKERLTDESSAEEVPEPPTAEQPIVPEAAVAD